MWVKKQLIYKKKTIQSLENLKEFVSCIFWPDHKLFLADFIFSKHGLK